jgi:hypothetical protein
MRTAMAVLLIAVVASVAAANPSPYWPSAGVTFDPSGAYLPRVDPTPYTMGSFYVAVVCPMEQAHNVVTISFAIVVDPGVSLMTSYTSLLPGGLTIGDWTTGITLSSTEPIYDGPVVVCSGSVFYTGMPGEVRLVDHPEYPRWITNAAGHVYYYCLETNGGVYMDPTPTYEYCGWCDGTPVENTSWGAIKALYR